jgi:hypothetical protein
MSDRLPSPAAVKAPKSRLHPSSSSLRLHLPARSVAVGERPREANWGDGMGVGEDQADHELYGCRSRLFTADLRHNQPRRTQ